MPLEPLRAGYVDAARRDAAARLADGRAQAAALVADARRQADLVVARARTEAADGVHSEVDREAALTRRRASTRVLAARAEAEAELRSRLIAGVRADPRYRDLVASVEAEARARLGPHAVLVEAAVGGVRAKAPGRALDFSVPALVERHLAGMGPTVEELWR